MVQNLSEQVEVLEGGRQSLLYFSGIPALLRTSNEAAEREGGGRQNWWMEEKRK